MGTSHVALTARIVVCYDVFDHSALLTKPGHELDEHFDIRHVTLKMESAAYALRRARLNDSCVA